MIIKMRYENVYQEIEVDTEEMREWLNVEVVDEENVEEFIQEEIDKRYNRPDYNNYHKHYRHWGMPPKPYRKEDEASDETDGIDQIPDYSYEIAEAQQMEYEKARKLLATALPNKPEWVDMIMAIEIDGESVNDYAAKVGTHPSNISHKLTRAKKKLKKIIGNPSDFVLR